MAALDELLEDAVGQIKPQLSIADIELAARRRRRHRHAYYGTIVCLVAAAVLATTFVIVDDSMPRTVTAQGEAEGVFSNPTGDALIFDDGYDGVTAVDLDRRVAARQFVDGGAGDQLYRLSRIDDSLVVGWGEISSTPLDGGPPMVVGNATMYLPAVEPGRLWLIDYPGGRVGLGTPQVRQVDLAGNVFVDTLGLEPSQGPPIIGIPGGLAYQGRNGLLLWDAHTGAITQQLGDRPAFPLDVDGNTVAWCQTPCTELHLSTIGTESDRTVTVPAGMASFAGYRGEFSPDGQLLAVVATDTTGPLGPTTRSRVVIVNTEQASTQSMTPEIRAQGLNTAWSPDGHRLYFATNSYQKPTTKIGMYTLGRRHTDWATVAFGGALRFLAVPRDEATRLLTAPVVKADACPPPNRQPSGRTTSSGCAFRVAVLQR